MNYKIKLVICLSFILLIILINRVFIYPHYSVVKIIGENDIYEKIGYGIVYKKNKKTYIVTNYHIVKDCNKVVIQYGLKESVAHVINSDEYEDIAILSVKNNRKLLVAPFQKKYHINDKVWINNKKIGHIISTSEKKLIDLSDGQYLLNVLKIRIPITEGDSGKPLYLGNNIIGMISMVEEDNKYIGYAIDINQALKTARKLEKGPIKRLDLNIELASTSNKKILRKHKLKTYGLKGVIVTNKYNSTKFKKGDIIVSINNHRIKDITHFKYYLFNSDKYEMLVYRNKKYIKIKG